MRYALCSLVLLIVATTSKAQFTTASNGLNTASSAPFNWEVRCCKLRVSIGCYDFHILKGSNKYFSILNNGNVGIGTSNPVQKIINTSCHLVMQLIWRCGS
jgi:hypothetical protein